jgi:murein DD-endopeptidase MepM/ murein hydrolase activator NlpD
VPLTDLTESPLDDAPVVRRRDLREPSTARSRRAARKRADAIRMSQPARPTAHGPRRRAAQKPVKPTKPLGQRIVSKLVAVVALGAAGLFVVSTSIPASAFSSPTVVVAGTPLKHTVSSTIQGQTLSAVGGETTQVARDAFSAISLKEAPIFNYSTNTSYTVNNSGVIRWPFPVAVPLGDLFGPRVAPCAGCSTFHNGTDFQPGDGAPIYAIAKGTVTVSEFSGSLGQHVAISHTINGKTFTSIYGHMQAGSSKLKVGQKVSKSDIVGLVGSTGESTGPHLDFEIDINGTPVDSFVWLKANTKH